MVEGWPGMTELSARMNVRCVDVDGFFGMWGLVDGGCVGGDEWEGVLFCLGWSSVELRIPACSTNGGLELCGWRGVTSALFTMATGIGTGGSFSSFTSKVAGSAGVSADTEGALVGLTVVFNSARSSAESSRSCVEKTGRVSGMNSWHFGVGCWRLLSRFLPGESLGGGGIIVALSDDFGVQGATTPGMPTGAGRESSRATWVLLGKKDAQSSSPKARSIGSRTAIVSDLRIVALSSDVLIAQADSAGPAALSSSVPFPLIPSFSSSSSFSFFRSFPKYAPSLTCLGLTYPSSTTPAFFRSSFAFSSFSSLFFLFAMRVFSFSLILCSRS